MLTQQQAQLQTRQPSFGLQNLYQWLVNWSERRRQRQALADLDQRLLDDVGISGEEQIAEISKPFWRR